MNKMRSLINVEHSLWQRGFDNWNHMSLNSEMREGEDFTLVSEKMWLKITSTFGGAPEIPFFRIKNYKGEDEIDLEPIHLNFIV